MSKLKMTNKEKFLISIYTFLLCGQDRAPEGEFDMRDYEEVDEIMNDKEKFLSLEDVQGEMKMFGLTENDFNWE